MGHGASACTQLMSHAQLAGAVLCGGRSTRMGLDKTAVAVAGETLLDRGVRRLREIADPIILATGARDIIRDGCMSVRDAVPGAGPLAGLVAALEASPHEHCAIVAVDMPDFDTALLLRLAVGCAGADAAVPRSAHGREPLHAVYARRALPPLQRALDAGVRALQEALHGLQVREVDAKALGAAPGFAHNLNTPADLTAWAASPRAAPTRRPPPRRARR